MEKVKKLINILKLKWLKDTVRNNYSYCSYNSYIYRDKYNCRQDRPR
ncbi:MAG: hypothetical protein K2H53_05045 [Clostridia bacterium]|nr:hypothetical protein [Clostridia bacterium]